MSKLSWDWAKKKKIKEKGLMDMDNTVVIAGWGGSGRGYGGINGDGKIQWKCDGLKIKCMFLTISRFLLEAWFLYEYPSLMCLWN